MNMRRGRKRGEDVVRERNNRGYRLVPRLDADQLFSQVGVQYLERGKASKSVR
jgi:hypothetical protein